MNAFLKPFQKAGHTIAHFDPAVCGHIGSVGQTNVILRELCFIYFFSAPSSSLSVVSVVLDKAFHLFNP